MYKSTNIVFTQPKLKFCKPQNKNQFILKGST